MAETFISLWADWTKGNTSLTRSAPGQHAQVLDVTTDSKYIQISFAYVQIVSAQSRFHV